MNRCTEAIVLAAGGSKRLGHPKQLVRYRGTTLLDRVVDQLIRVDCDRITVVLGADAATIARGCPSLSGRPPFERVETVINPLHREGQSTSLRCGLGHVLNRAAHGPIPRGRVLIALCDQPMIPTRHYRELVSINGDANPVVTTDYGDRGGVPMCIDGNLIDDLVRHLAGDVGAKIWIENQPGPVRRVVCPEAFRDIDTPKDLERWLERDSERWLEKNPSGGFNG